MSLAATEAKEHALCFVYTCCEASSGAATKRALATNLTSGVHSVTFHADTALFRNFAYVMLSVNSYPTFLDSLTVNRL
jgi:hypothetical protein